MFPSAAGPPSARNRVSSVSLGAPPADLGKQVGLRLLSWSGRTTLTCVGPCARPAWGPFLWARRADRAPISPTPTYVSLSRVGCLRVYRGGVCACIGTVGYPPLPTGNPSAHPHHLEKAPVAFPTAEIGTCGVAAKFCCTLARLQPQV